MTAQTVAAVRKWRDFAGAQQVMWRHARRPWADHITRPGGFVDETALVQPTIFPAFAAAFLGWTVNTDLFPETTGDEGRPDFRPDDQITHPFVFETKGTSEGTALTGHDLQIRRYLVDGAPRIRQVVVTNMLGIQVFERDLHGDVKQVYTVNLAGLLNGPLDTVAEQPNAAKFARFLDEFSRRQLTPDEMVDQVRHAPPWNRIVETTSSDWVLVRLDRVVRGLTADVTTQIEHGALQDTSQVDMGEQAAVLAELRMLAARLGYDDSSLLTLGNFLAATDASLPGKALAQYASHVAYYAATRLLLVRTWEDLSLLPPMLYDGGFDEQMERFGNVISDVVRQSFQQAGSKYRSLFDQTNTYTWFTPTDDTYKTTIYDLANTYLGAVQSDVLGQVYERLLERVDRKLLGVYYTPRDVIALIWDLIGLEAISAEAEQQDRQPRILDIATGSGGFLVEASARLRQDVVERTAQGANVPLQKWLNNVGDGLHGVEQQRFAAYLAELNLLVQLGQVLAADAHLRLPPLGILCTDTLSLHEPETMFENRPTSTPVPGSGVSAQQAQDRTARLSAAAENNYLMDVACGNPPYIGEKTAAAMMARTRAEHPYWNGYVGEHMDYLYWFLILGVSKVRPGGRFGFITPEYWLRAAGARPLRKYLAERTSIDRILLFRDFRLFPDAPGHHSMIITGTRFADPDSEPLPADPPAPIRPRVSIYEGPMRLTHPREAIFDAMRRGGRDAAQVRSFTGCGSPNTLGGQPWHDVILTRQQTKARARFTQGPQVSVDIDEGVIATMNNLTAKKAVHLTAADMHLVGESDKAPGVQVLSPLEVERLGPLNPAEIDVVRRWIRTKDVYPYAVVLPDDAPSVLYLVRPDDLPGDSTRESIIRTTPFPTGMPKVSAHLTPFRAALEATTIAFKDRRPWWTLHRGRPALLADATDTGDGWTNFAVTDRWTPGGRLIAGLAPARSAPASGLHVLRPATGEVSAAYLTAFLNSTLFQQTTDSLPPGQLRKADLVRLGLPLRADDRIIIETASRLLAGHVRTLVREHARRFPALPETLRADLTLSDLTEHIWSPASAPTSSGPIRGLTWVNSVQMARAGTTRLDQVHVDDATLFGLQVVCMSQHATRPVPGVIITLIDSGTPALARAVAAACRAAIHNGGRARDLADLVLHINPDEIIRTYDDDQAALLATAEQYRDQRAAIDRIFEG